VKGNRLIFHLLYFSFKGRDFRARSRPLTRESHLTVTQRALLRLPLSHRGERDEIVRRARTLLMS